MLQAADDDGAHGMSAASSGGGFAAPSAQTAEAGLRQALAIPREREKLLRLEQKLVATIQDESTARLEMQPMTQANRDLVQALADFFGFDAFSWKPRDVNVGDSDGVGQLIGVTLVRLHSCSYLPSQFALRPALDARCCIHDAVGARPHHR